MNNQRTVILAIVLAAILVACSVGAAVITHDNSSDDKDTRTVTDTSTYSHLEKNRIRSDNAIVVGNTDDALGAFIPPRHPDSLTMNSNEAIVIPSRPAGSVGTSDLQMLLATFCPDTSVNFLQYMIDNVLYKGQELTSFSDVMTVLKAENYQFYKVSLVSNNGPSMPLLTVTVEDFICHAVCENQESLEPISIGVPDFTLKNYF